MSKLIVRLLSLPALALIVSIAASAQGTFDIKNTASGRVYTDGDSFDGIIGSNAHLTLIGSFEPSSSGSCGYPYPTLCNNLRILYLSQNAGVSEFVKMISVSTAEIKIIAPNFPAGTSDYNDFNDYNIIVQKQFSPGQWYATHIRQNIWGLKSSSQPFAEIRNFGVHGNLLSPVGVLYGFMVDSQGNITGAEPLQSIGAAAMPRTHNGHPTFLQLYYTGVHSSHLSADIFRVSVGAAPLYDTHFDGVNDTGVYVKNVFAPVGGWTSGPVDIEIGRRHPTVSLAWNQSIEFAWVLWQ